MRYDWKSDKAERVERKHNIKFEKLKDVFDDPFAVEFIDEEHSTDDEIRFGIIGLTS